MGSVKLLSPKILASVTVKSDCRKHSQPPFEVINPSYRPGDKRSLSSETGSESGYELKDIMERLPLQQEQAA